VDAECSARERGIVSEASRKKTRYGMAAFVTPRISSMQNNEKLMKELAIISFLMMSFEESYTRNKKKYTKNLPIEDKIVPI